MPPPAHIDTQPIDLPAAPQLVEHRHHHARARARDRMAEAAPTAVDVHDGVVDAELTAGGHGHRAERLVDLEQVDVAHLHAGALERLRDGEDGRQPGARRIVTNRRPRDDASEGSEPVG